MKPFNLKIKRQLQSEPRYDARDIEIPFSIMIPEPCRRQLQTTVLRQ